MKIESATSSWASEEFGHVDLGDSRRTTRLVRMAARVAQCPAGRVSDVFAADAERQGAYDFLESSHTRAADISEGMARASLARCAKDEYAFVPIDGTSLTLVDRLKAKNFGAVGTYTQGARGLKVIHSYVVDARGVPCGACAQVWWTRPDKRPVRKPSRPLATKESLHWITAIAQTSELFEHYAPRTKPWFQLDREGDCWSTLRRLVDAKLLFTVRAAWNRRVKTRRDGTHRYVRDELQKTFSLGTTYLDIPQRQGRRARRATLGIRATKVTLDLKNSWSKVRYKRDVFVLLVREQRTTPRGEKPVEWLLFTSFEVKTLSDAHRVIFGYAQRWRIEEFHKSWKSGTCRVEETQLRDKAHVCKWATLLAAVASRIERLKYLARESSASPASEELSQLEIRALLFLKRKQKKRTEEVPDAVPTMGQAVRWIADLGGYTGKSSGGPPGSRTITRGFEKIEMAAEVFEMLETRTK